MDPASMTISNFGINELLLRKTTTPKFQWLAKPAAVLSWASLGLNSLEARLELLMSKLPGVGLPQFMTNISNLSTNITQIYHKRISRPEG